MKFKKGFSIASLGLSSVLLLAACGNDESTSSNNAEGGEEEAQPVSLRLAHNQGEDHPIHTSLVEFKDIAAEKSDDSVEIEIFPSGQLGDERGVIELVKSGTLDMAKVSASALESFDDNYAIFSLPYVFQSEEHYFEVMENSEAVQEIFQNTRDEGFFSMGWYTGGQRSIYTADKEVSTPEDLNGMKIRVQDSPTSISMIEAMGGAPTPMSFGEVYTSLQQGVVDGAESNETALTTNNHGEVAKAYSYTEHQYTPDVLIVSTSMWDGLSEEQQQAMTDAAVESAESHKQVWADAIDQAIADGEEMGVTYYEIDKQPFIDAAAPLHESYQEENEDNKRYFEDFQSYVQ